MTDKTKTIQEVLAEVQKNVELIKEEPKTVDSSVGSSPKTGFAGKLPAEYGFRAYRKPGSGATKAISKIAGTSLGPAGTAAAVVAPELGKAMSDRYKEQHSGGLIPHQTTPGVSAADSFERMKKMKAPETSATKEVPTISAPKGPTKVAPPTTKPSAAPSKTSSDAQYTKGGYFMKSPNVSKGDYTIKKGETLSGIAKAQGTTVGAIQSMNKGLKDINKIAAGGSLNLPTSTKSTAAPAASPPAPTTKSDTSPTTSASVTPSKPKEDSGVVARRDIRQGSQDMLGGVIDAVRQAPGSGERFKSGASQLGTGFKEAGQHAVDLAKGALDRASSSLGKNAEQQRSKPEYESGEKKDKKKMSEESNPLIAAFLKLQETKATNIFEAAKKAKKDYDKDGEVESPKDEVWGSRFRAAKAAGKMEEGSMIDPKDPSVQGGSDVTSTPVKSVKPVAPKKVDGDPSYQGSGDVTMSGKPVRVREEVEFSQAEIDHINSFFEAVAPSRAEPTKSVNPSVSNISLTDDTLAEGRPKKNPTPETTERDARQHIQVIAGRAAAGNTLDFPHNDGSKSKITPAMGRKIVSHLQGLKPAERQAAVNKMHASSEGLKI